MTDLQPKQEFKQQEVSRRNLLSRIAIGATATLATGAMTGVLSKTAFAADAPSAAPSDLDVLNFALSLEHLETAFYAQVLGAHKIRGYLTPRMVEVTDAILANENSHVATLEAAIVKAGGSPAPAGTYQFPNNVFISPLGFTWFAFTLEEIGIGAYLGAVGGIQSDALRKAAASIYGAEARHAAILRSLGGFTFSPRYFESPLTVAQVQGLITPYVA